MDLLASRATIHQFYSPSSTLHSRSKIRLSAVHTVSGHCELLVPCRWIVVMQHQHCACKVTAAIFSEDSRVVSSETPRISDKGSIGQARFRVSSVLDDCREQYRILVQKAAFVCLVLTRSRRFWLAVSGIFQSAGAHNKFGHPVA